MFGIIKVIVKRDRTDATNTNKPNIFVDIGLIKFSVYEAKIIIKKRGVLQKYSGDITIMERTALPIVWFWG